MSANDLTDLLALAERLIDGYPEDVFPPMREGFTAAYVHINSRDQYHGDTMTPDAFAADVLRVVALPVIADLVAALREQAEQLDTLRNAIDEHRRYDGHAIDSCCNADHRLWAAAGGGVYHEEGATDE